MVKSIISFAAVTLFIIFAASSGKNPAETEVGSMAPNFTLSNADTTLSLQQLRGEYVVVTFWDSALPETRMANLKYDRMARSGNFAHVAINTDRSQRLHEELCRIDRLNASTQFYSAEAKSLLSEWKQSSDHMDSFLISPEGVIIALNPTDETLERLASR